MNIKRRIMKVIALNASPNKEAGTTALVLNPFLKGMASEGADIEVKYIYDMKIEPCRACTSSVLFESQSDCQIEDDMQELYPSLNEADLWIFASPNYLNSVTSGLKNLLDRLEPLFEPPHIYENNACHDKIRQSLPKRTTPGSILLISTCGLWSMDNFNSIVEQTRAVADMLGRKYLPPILRPHSGVMTTLTNLGKPVRDIYQAAEEAGVELMKNNEFNLETINRISREIVPEDSFIQELSLIVK